MTGCTVTINESVATKLPESVAVTVIVAEPLALGASVNVSRLPERLVVTSDPLLLDAAKSRVESSTSAKTLVRSIVIGGAFS